jgi:hypothetical protein
MRSATPLAATAVASSPAPSRAAAQPGDLPGRGRGKVGAERGHIDVGGGDRQAVGQVGGGGL